MIVVDASALVDFLLERDPSGAIAKTFAGVALHAPVTLDAEVLHALRKRWIAKTVTVEAAGIAIRGLQRAPITRHPVQPLVARMWDLRQNITAYDAAYVALAESLDAPLITRDARLARSSGHAARIDYIE